MRRNKLSKIDLTRLVDKPWCGSQRPVLQTEGMKLEFSGFGLLCVRRGTFRGFVSAWRWCGKFYIAFRSASVNSSPSSRSMIKHLRNDSRASGFKEVTFLGGDCFS